MDRWANKVAVVTGASSGIGEGIAIALAEHGIKVVGLARRLEKMKKIAENLKHAKGAFFPVQCDVTKEEDIIEGFRFAELLGGVDILINSAGLGYGERIIDGSTESFKTILNVNVLSTVICIREATRCMRERNTMGHIININSVLGHPTCATVAPLSLYQPSKFAVTATTDVVANEIAMLKAPIKITNLSPGLVKTDMPLVQSYGGAKFFSTHPHLEIKDVADAVLYVLGTPPNVQVKELTITALHEMSGILGGAASLRQ